MCLWTGTLYTFYIDSVFEERNLSLVNQKNPPPLCFFLFLLSPPAAKNPFVHVPQLSRNTCLLLGSLAVKRGVCYVYYQTHVLEPVCEEVWIHWSYPHHLQISHCYTIGEAGSYCSVVEGCSVIEGYPAIYIPWVQDMILPNGQLERVIGKEGLWWISFWKAPMKG